MFSYFERFFDGFSDFSTVVVKRIAVTNKVASNQEILILVKVFLVVGDEMVVEVFGNFNRPIGVYEDFVKRQAAEVIFDGFKICGHFKV